MRLLLSILLLQLFFSVQAFHRLGTVSGGGTSGTIYLIDSNTLFLAGFSTSGSGGVVFRGGSGANEVTATTGASLSGANMMLDGSSDWLNVSPIEVRTVNGDNLIASFDVPGNIQIPCSAEYLGRFSLNPNGPLSTHHALAGHVFFDASNRRLFVAGLYLDGSAPAAYMWLSTSTTPLSTGMRAGYNGGYGRVDDVNNLDVNVTYPPGGVNKDYRSLSVWCEDFTVSFGHVIIPVVSDSFACTEPDDVSLGFSPAKHGVSAKVFVVGPNTFGLRNVYYDGNAPATWYWAGTTGNVDAGFIVADQTGSLETLSAISNANVVLTLPTDFDICNTNFLSVYCVQASVSFGEVYSSSFGCSGCPAMCKTVGVSGPVFQCQELSSREQIEYRYDANNSLVTFRFQVCNLEANEYFAFGISASSSGVAMSPNGDVVVCQVSATGVIDCSDYDLTIRSQCASSAGVYAGACPDTVLTGGVNNYVNTDYQNVNGRATFTTTRAVYTTDSHDRNFTIGTEQSIIWARGGTFDAPPNGNTYNRWVLRHEPTNRISATEPILIDFGANRSCSTPLFCPTTTPAPLTPWRIPPLCISSENNEINAAIGNTGGTQGYKGITSKDGWGIAWYLNGSLIPEVYVLRGTTVRFYVNGGDDASESAEFHPLYITTSSQGGINVLAESGDTITETVLAGLSYNPTTGVVSDLTVGPFCEWVETGGNGNNFNTFDAYKDSLEYTCNAGNVSTGSFEWTPDSTGDYYYQCATHRLLGWKIRVVDDLTECFFLQSAAYQVMSYTLLLFLGVALTMLYAF